MTQPKSTREHQLDGTYRPDRHGGRVDAEFPVETPQPPEHLTEAEQRLWWGITSNYPAGVLTGTDFLMLELLVRWLSRWRRYDELLQSNPSDYKLVQLAAMASKQIFAACSKLGLSPVDRRKLQAPTPPEEADELTELLRRRNESGQGGVR